MATGKSNAQTWAGPRPTWGGHAAHHCDNSVVVEQVSSGTAKPIARLASLLDEARALLNSFDQATLVWIPAPSQQRS